MYNVEKSDKCNLCDFASSRSCHLRTHLKKHTGEKPKKCNLCDLASFHANNLTRHLNRHSGEKPKMQPQRIWKIKEMLFVWLCILPVMPIGETFSKHTGEKPNNCKECDLASFQANSLTRHLNRHSGEKPNELLQICLLSGRHLRRLLKTQSGEKWTHM